MSGIPVVAASSFTYQEPEEMSRVVKELHGTTVGDGDVVEEIGANCQQFMSVTGHSMSGSVEICGLPPLASCCQLAALQECVLNCKVTSAAVQKKEEAMIASSHRYCSTQCAGLVHADSAMEVGSPI